MSSSINALAKYKALFHQIFKSACSEPSAFINPDTSFTRNRILSADLVAKLPFQFSDKSISRMIPFIPDLKNPAISPSAISQARDKINSNLYVSIFNEFNRRTANDNTALFKGYRLAAVDGSEIRVLPDPSNPALTYGRKKKGGHHHFFHLNAQYDPLNHIFVNAILQPGSLKNEDSALIELAQSADDHSIFIADRGYEALLTFYRLNHKNVKFVIRIKDETSAISILKHYPTPESEEYDIDFDVILTSKNNSKVKENKHLYKYISTYKKAPEFSDQISELPLHCRVIRYKAVSEGKESFITVLCNLPREEFNSDDVKEIYRLRWQEEVSFNTLKNKVELNQIHSRKANNVIAEIYAKMTVFNICSRVRNALEERKKKKKHTHKIDFGLVIDLCRENLFRRRTRNDFDELIRSRTLPERPGRSDNRKRE